VDQVPVAPLGDRDTDELAAAEWLNARRWPGLRPRRPHHVPRRGGLHDLCYLSRDDLPVLNELDDPLSVGRRAGAEIGTLLRDPDFVGARRQRLPVRQDCLRDRDRRMGPPRYRVVRGDTADGEGASDDATEQ
jgi:hypothetical protein